ncbi:multicopper oxidase domain-containing protein [Rhizosphaericola mali]|uniref:Multicopper oxidase domain-containing protein n=2 Tax=Rhizosphaericola mali TaxID=2545455 RepID=A0A5P2GH01_9BACT|nr:multicopper oxidase domain-containing protein [Rhizosphaericola mali]
MANYTDSARLPERMQHGTNVTYHLYVTDTMVSYNKHKPVMGMAINGAIPGPALNFTLGDTAWIYVHNLTDMETSIHWHGLILPNEEDGVPYLTTAPVKAHGTHLYKFPITHTGTYWYHSHDMLQQQSGLYGAFIVRKKDDDRSHDYTLVLSDWTNDKPEQVNRFLHQGNDWYAIKKHAVQSYGEAIVSGHLGTKIGNEWKRMEAMDVSDVAYDAFTSNGKINQYLSQYHKGDKVHIHVVNGSSSTYFWLTWAGGKMSVVANDGMPVKPVPVDKMIIGTAETYDIELTIPENMQYELRATSEDRIGHTSTWFGKGMKMEAPNLGRLDYFAGMKMMNKMMNMNGTMNDMGMDMSLQKMDMNKVMYPELKKTKSSTMTKDTSMSSSMRKMDMSHMDHMQGMSGMKMSDSKNEPVVLNYAMLESPTPTTLPEGKWKTLTFELWGNMNRYVWTINNKTVSESDAILIKRGENIRIILKNQSMMRHPMHLHGHFFRVLNGSGEYSPLKNTLDIMPMETDTLEFHGSEYGDWFFHCHILYHMMSGMGRIFRYENSPYNPQVPDPDKAYKIAGKDDQKIYPHVDAEFQSNNTNGTAELFNTRYRLWTDWAVGYNSEAGYSSETHFGRYIGKMQWFLPYVGWDFRHRTGNFKETNIFGQSNTKNDRRVFCMGFQYTLPMLITADTRIDTEGKLRVQFSKNDIAITEKIRGEAMWDTDKEWSAGVRYIMGKYWGISAHYDSNIGVGAGISLNY